MKISPVSFYSYQFKGSSFEEPQRKVCEDYQNAMPMGQVYHKGALFNRHGTMYFRSDLDWIKFGKYLKNKFSNCNKVQSLIWGCSAGHEAYSYSILLKYIFDDDFKKFLPIEAMDIDSELIKKNQNQKQAGIVLNTCNIDTIKNGLGILSNDFYTQNLPEFCKLRNGNYQFSDEISDSVNFSYSNILTSLDRIDSSAPAIVMCRNMWPYVAFYKYDDFAEELYKKLKAGSVVVVGGYDWSGKKAIANSGSFPKTLIEKGFKPVYDIHIMDGSKNTPLVFEK